MIYFGVVATRECGLKNSFFVAAAAAAKIMDRAASNPCILDVRAGGPTRGGEALE